MCGIVGFVGSNKNKKKIIKAMTDRLIHRGPDSEGFYIDKFLALGHRRLAIIDLKAGFQPMFNEDKTLVTIFNGEIYNFLELKKFLINSGHIFKTNSDTEVLLHGYEEWGINLPKKLRGMFAFVIYDKKQKILYGAKDHFGIKPLYYYHNKNTFLFASEIKAFLDHPEFIKELNYEIIGPYLSFSYSPCEETFFKNVYELKPGHYFLYKENKLKIEPYFNLNFIEKDFDYPKLITEISHIMEDSINHHILSDVEVGSFLSSGIDSSYIVSLAKPNKTYTVGYDIPKYNEIELAQELTDLLKINNTSKIITKSEYLNIIPKIMYHLDEPLADPAAVALYFVSELASKDVKVVLSGEGADEFFGGYNYYREEVDYAIYNKIPFLIRNLIAKIASKFKRRKGINFLVRRGTKLEDRYIGVTSVFSEKEINEILKIKNNITLKSLTKPVYETQRNQNKIVKMQTIDITFWLQKDILRKADRMTMAHSIEGRLPFTDIEVFKLAKTIPQKYKITKENTKVALREAGKKVIPNESYKKKKLGFPVPLRQWIKSDEFYNKINLTFNSVFAKEIFNYDKIQQLLEDHRNEKKDNYQKIWTIYCFLIWYEQFFQ